MMNDREYKNNKSEKKSENINGSSIENKNGIKNKSEYSIKNETGSSNENKSGNIIYHRFGFLWTVACIFFLVLLMPLSYSMADTGTTPTPTPPPAVKGVVSAFVLYETEEIEVNSTQKVYYTVLKNNTAYTVKPSELIPAARKGTFDIYSIDISTLAAGKTAYIGIATTLTPNSDGVVDIMIVPVAAMPKKVDFNMNYAAVGDKAKGRNLLYSVVITDADGTVVTYDHSGRNNEKIKDIKLLNIQWRKGSNCDWLDIDELTKVIWDSVCASGATLNFRIGAINQTGQKTGQRYSKEVKIKLTVTKTPSVKIDVNKLSVSFKNGMQFRLAGADDLSWKTVLPFQGKSSEPSVIRTSAAVGDFDPYTEDTKTKVSAVAISDIYKALSINEPVGEETVKIEYRTAPTTKKTASFVGTLEIPSQAAAPTVTIGSDAVSVKLSTVASALTDKTLNPAYEYLIVMNEDLAPGKTDMTAMKWTAIKQGGLIKNTAKNSYTLLNGTKRAVSYTDKGAVLLFRRKGVAASAKTTTVLASKYVSVTPPEAPPTPSPTPTPTPTPSGS